MPRLHHHVNCSARPSRGGGEEEGQEGTAPRAHNVAQPPARPHRGGTNARVSASDPHPYLAGDFRGDGRMFRSHCPKMNYLGTEAAGLGRSRYGLVPRDGAVHRSPSTQPSHQAPLKPLPGVTSFHFLFSLLPFRPLYPARGPALPLSPRARVHSLLRSSPCVSSSHFLPWGPGPTQTDLQRLPTSHHSHVCSAFSPRPPLPSGCFSTCCVSKSQVHPLPARRLFAGRAACRPTG